MADLPEEFNDWEYINYETIPENDFSQAVVDKEINNAEEEESQRAEEIVQAVVDKEINNAEEENSQRAEEIVPAVDIEKINHAAEVIVGLQVAKNHKNEEKVINREKTAEKRSPMGETDLESIKKKRKLEKWRTRLFVKLILFEVITACLILFYFFYSERCDMRVAELRKMYANMGRELAEKHAAELAEMQAEALTQINAAMWNVTKPFINYWMTWTTNYGAMFDSFLFDY